MLLALCCVALAAVLHPPHLAGDQRQPHRRPDRGGDGGDDRRGDALAAQRALPAGSADRCEPTNLGDADREPSRRAISGSSTRARLVALAKAYHVKVRVMRRVGHFVPAGTAAVDGLPGRTGSPPTQREELLDTRSTSARSQDAAAGRRVRRVADRRYRAEGDLAGGERSDHGRQLRRPVEPHPDPFRLARGSRRLCCTIRRHGSRQHQLDRFRRLADVGV